MSQHPGLTSGVFFACNLGTLSLTIEPNLGYTNQAARLKLERWSSWLKAPGLKTGEDSRPPWVQIPLSPPQGEKAVFTAFSPRYNLIFGEVLKW